MQLHTNDFRGWCCSCVCILRCWFSARNLQMVKCLPWKGIWQDLDPSSWIWRRQPTKRTWKVCRWFLQVPLRHRLPKRFAQFWCSPQSRGVKRFEHIPGHSWSFLPHRLIGCPRVPRILRTLRWKGAKLRHLLSVASMSLKLVDPSIDSMEYQRGTSSKNAVVLVMTSHVCFSDQLQFCQASAIAPGLGRWWKQGTIGLSNRRFFVSWIETQLAQVGQDGRDGEDEIIEALG